MPEKRFEMDEMTSMLTMQLIGCGYPVSSPEDVIGLFYAVAQTEIAVVTSDEKKIARLVDACETLLKKFLHHRGAKIEAMITAAISLQKAALDRIAEIHEEMLIV